MQKSAAYVFRSHLFSDTFRVRLCFVNPYALMLFWRVVEGSKQRKREEGYLRTSRSCFPADEHLRLFLYPRLRTVSPFCFISMSALAWKRHIHERFFFLMSTTPRNREGTVEEEETRSGLCRSCDVHEPGDFSKGSHRHFPNNAYLHPDKPIRYTVLEESLMHRYFARIFHNRLTFVQDRKQPPIKIAHNGM